MTEDKSLKQLIRARMAKTGESYTTSRRFFRKPKSKEMAKQTRKIRLVGENLVLRRFDEADMDLVQAGFQATADSDSSYDWFAQIKKVMSPEKYLRSQLERSGNIVENPGLQLQIFNRAEDAWMGYVAIYQARLNVSNASLDYYLLNQFWRKGIATEAVKLALSYCWDVGLHRIEATIDDDNAASIRFAEQLGMIYEGIRREGAFINGRWRDLRVYSTLVGEIE